MGHEGMVTRRKRAVAPGGIIACPHGRRRRGVWDGFPRAGDIGSWLAHRIRCVYPTVRPMLATVGGICPHDGGRGGIGTPGWNAAGDTAWPEVERLPHAYWGDRGRALPNHPTSRSTVAATAATSLRSGKTASGWAAAS